jgi:hypothetical protein
MTTTLNGTGLSFYDGSSQSTTTKVGQVIGTSVSSLFTGTSGSWVDITGVSVTITPKSTASKVLVMYHAYTSTPAAAQGTINAIGTRLVRNGTVIAIADPRNSAAQTTTQGATNFGGICGTSHDNMYLDSPGTTAAVTYKLQLWCYDAAAVVGGTYATAYQTYTIGLCAPTTITAMEILP